MTLLLGRVETILCVLVLHRACRSPSHSHEGASVDQRTSVATPRATRARAGVSGSARARPRARSAAFRAVWCVYLLSCKSVRTRCGTAENDRYRAKRGKLISFFRVSLRPYLDLSATSAPARPQTQTARPQLRACFRSPNPPARHRGWLKGIVPTRHRQLPPYRASLVIDRKHLYSTTARRAPRRISRRATTNKQALLPVPPRRCVIDPLAQPMGARRHALIGSLR